MIVVQRHRIRFFIMSSITFYTEKKILWIPFTMTSERTVYPGIHTVTWTGWTQKVRQIVNNTLRLQVMCPWCKGELSIFLPSDSCLSNVSTGLDFYLFIAGQRFLFIPQMQFSNMCMAFNCAPFHIKPMVDVLRLRIWYIWQVWVNVILCLNGMNVCGCCSFFVALCPNGTSSAKQRVSFMAKQRRKKQHSNRRKWSVLCDEIFLVGRFLSLWETPCILVCLCRLYGTDGPISNFLIHTHSDISRRCNFDGFPCVIFSTQNHFRIFRTRLIVSRARIWFAHICRRSHSQIVDSLLIQLKHLYDNDDNDAKEKM